MNELRLRSEIIPRVEPIPGVPGASVLTDVLSAEECAEFLRIVEYDQKLDTTEIEGDRPVWPRRITFRSKVENEDLANDFLDRLRPVLPEILEFHEEDPEMGGLLVGQWKIHSINPQISFLKYTEGGVFTRHRDGIYIAHEDLRSMITILVYLNGEYSGGRTCAFSDDESIVFPVEPAPGKAFCMLQRVLHEGGEVLSGEKHVVRLDILYERQTALDPERYEQNQLASHYLQMAQDFERAHQGMKAVEYYKKAFRPNPGLEQLM